MIFMLFLFLLLPIYNNVYKIARRSIVEESYRKLHEGVLTVDGNIQRMTELAGICREMKICQIIRHQRQPGYKGLLYDPQASGGINQAVEISGCPSEVFILFNDNPIVLSDSMAATRTGEFYGKLIRYENMEEGDFMVWYPGRRG